MAGVVAKGEGRQSVGAVSEVDKGKQEVGKEGRNAVAPISHSWCVAGVDSERAR